MSLAAGSPVGLSFLILTVAIIGCREGDGPTGPSSATETVLRGSFSGQFATAERRLSTGNTVCSDQHSIQGSLSVRLTQTSPAVTGTAEWSGTNTVTSTTCPLGVVGTNPFSGESLAISGPPDNLRFSQVVTSSRPIATGTVNSTFTRTLSGAFAGGVLTGSVTFAIRHESPGQVGEGSVVMPITAR